MLIDWFTVGAQLVNFAILVWLLKRLLYRRVLEAMDRRQQSILEEARQADEIRREAEREALAYGEKIAEFEEGLATKTRAVDEEVGAYRLKQLGKARQEIADQREAWGKSLQRQHGEFENELRHLLGELICEAARKMVADLADVSLEGQLLRQFAKTLTADPAKRDTLIGEGGVLKVGTSFVVDAETEAEVRKILGECLPAGVEVAFEQDDIGTGVGVTLRIGSFRLEWSADSYARSLADDVKGALVSERRKSLSAGGLPVVS